MTSTPTSPRPVVVARAGTQLYWPPGVDVVQVDPSDGYQVAALLLVYKDDEATVKAIWAIHDQARKMAGSTGEIKTRTEIEHFVNIMDTGAQNDALFLVWAERRLLINLLSDHKDELYEQAESVGIDLDELHDKLIRQSYGKLTIAIDDPTPREILWDLG